MGKISMKRPATRYLGRTYEKNGVLWMSDPATGIAFWFTGEDLSLTFLRGGASIGAENAPHVVVFIDGKRVADYLVTDAQTSVCVYQRAKRDCGTETKTAPTAKRDPVCITVLKASEGCESSLGICLVAESSDPRARMRATEEKAKLIEFIGDSITCGYGVNGTLGEVFSTRSEDATKAYAFLAATKLNCDYSMVAMSGHGVISGYTEADTADTTKLVMPYYETLGRCYTEDPVFTPQKIAWDFRRTADIVVVNLGTNDSSFCKNIKARKKAFADAYVRLLYKVRERNPRAKIWCALGVMEQMVYDSLSEAAKRFRSETGDREIYTLKFDLQRPEDGFAIDWHPTAVTQEKAAKRLVNELEKHVYD